jgi:hypothetical protein
MNLKFFEAHAISTAARVAARACRDCHNMQGGHNSLLFTEYLHEQSVMCRLHDMHVQWSIEFVPAVSASSY